MFAVQIYVGTRILKSIRPNKHILANLSDYKEPLPVFGLQIKKLVYGRSKYVPFHSRSLCNSASLYLENVFVQDRAFVLYVCLLSLFLRKYTCNSNSTMRFFVYRINLFIGVKFVKYKYLFGTLKCPDLNPSKNMHFQSSLFLKQVLR